MLKTEILLIFATYLYIVKQMKKIRLISLVTFGIFFSYASQAQILLNEAKINPPGTDNPFEFIELKGNPGGTVNNVYCCIIEGDSANAGTTDLVIKLNNVTLGSNGLYFIGTSLGYTINPPTIFRDTLIFGIPGGVIESGSQTYMLIFSSVPIIYDFDYDANDDGTLELPQGAVVLDAVGYKGGANSPTDILYSGAVLTQNTGTPDAIVRFYGNNVANSSAAWYCGDLTGSGTSTTFDPTVLSSNFPAGGALSPGDHNLPNTLSVNEITTNGKVVVSPNPAQNSIKLNGIKGNVNFEIFDLTGKLKLSGQLDHNQSEIELQDFSNGLYLLKVFNAENFYCSKFEIQK